MYALVGYAIVNDELEPPVSGRKYRPPKPDGYTTPPPSKTSPIYSSEPRKERRNKEWRMSRDEWVRQDQRRLGRSPKKPDNKNPAKAGDDGIKYFLHQRNSSLLF